MYFWFYNRIGGVMVSMLVSTAVDHAFEPRSGQTKDCKTRICCFSVKYATLRSDYKDWLARNKDDVCEWINMANQPLPVLVS
jgi:hypothetical protein